MKKSLRPQIVAPVQRETLSTSSVGEIKVGMVPSWSFPIPIPFPFAGDDAE